MPAIDYDRGVLIRSHYTGARVFMYHDQPGVFLNAYGSEVDPALAREAGFDVEALVKEKDKRSRIAEASRMIEQEFDPAQSQEVVLERDGFKVLHIGNEKYSVLDPDGVVLNRARPLTRTEADMLFNRIVPAPKEEAAQ